MLLPVPISVKFKFKSAMSSLNGENVSKTPKKCVLFMNGITETTKKTNPAKTVLAPTLRNSETSTL